MQVKMSEYLQQIKPLAKRLVDRLLEDYSYVSLLGTDTKGKLYSLKSTGVDLNDSRWSERGFVARVYNGENYSEYSFNELTEDSFEEVYSKINETASVMNGLMKAVDFHVTAYDVIEEAAIQEVFLSELEVEPTAMSHEDKLAKMRNIMDKTMAESDELVDARVSYEEAQVSKIFLSKDKDLEQSYVWTNGYVIPIGVREGKMKYTFLVVSGLKGPEILNELEGLYKNAVRDLNMLLGSGPIVPGE